MSHKSNISVYVSSNVERALKQLKKKIEREGVVRDMKRTVYFESPTQKRRKRSGSRNQTKSDAYDRQQTFLSSP